MKKNIPKDEAIRKGIIGYSLGGTNYKAFVSAIGGKHYIGYFEVRHEIGLAPEGGFCHSLKPGELSEVKEVKNFKQALRDVVSYGL
jgi:hypothetical protein